MSCFLYGQVQKDTILNHLSILKSNPAKINYLLELAYRFHAQQDTNRALFYAEKAVGISQKYPAMQGKSYYAMGNILFGNKEYHKALYAFKNAQILSSVSYDSITEIHSLNKISRIFLIQGRGIDSLLKYSKKAEQMARKMPDKLLLAESLYNLGDGYKFGGDFKKALETHLECLKIREQTGQLKDIAESLHALGWIYYEINPDDALIYHQRNVELHEQLHDEQAVGETLIAIGTCYLKKKEHEKALDYYLQALAIFEAPDFKTTSQSRQFWIGIVKNDIGWNYNEWGKPEKALPFLKASMEIRQKDGNPQMLSYVSQTLGETYLNLGQYQESEKYLLLTLKLTQQLGLRRDRMIVYRNLAKLAYAKGDLKSTILFKEKDNALKDSLFNEEKNKEIAYIQASFESDRIKVENELLHQELKLKQIQTEKQFWIMITVSGGLLSFMGMSFYLYRNNQQKQRLNHILKEQQEEIVSQNEEILSQNNEITHKNEELYQLIEELNRVNDYLDDMVRERTSLLEKQNQQLREYAFINAHKLRAPLASILGLVNLIKMSDYEKIDKNLIDHLRLSSERLDHIVHEIQQMLEEVEASGNIHPSNIGSN